MNFVINNEYVHGLNLKIYELEQQLRDKDAEIKLLMGLLNNRVINIKEKVNGNRDTTLST